MSRRAENSRRRQARPTVEDEMLQSSNSADGERHVLEYLKRLLGRSGWTCSESDQADLLIQRGADRLEVEVKLVRDAARTEQVRAYLADAFLRASTAGRQSDARPMAILVAPSISEPMARRLREYATAHLTEGAWAMLDGQGRAEFSGIEVEAAAMPPAKSFATKRKVERIDPFTDLNQWMLKVLLSPRVAAELSSASNLRVASTAELARAAEVSEPHAKRLVRYLRNSENLESRPHFRLRRSDDLLAQWASYVRAHSPLETPAKLVLPRKDVLGALRKTLSAPERGATRAGTRAALGLFSAAEALGLGHVSGAPVHLYLETADPSQWESLGLVATGPGEPASVMIRVPRWPETVFRGAVLREGVPCADVLQVWLDVQAHPARGAEQAEWIRRKALVQLLPQREP